MSTAVVGYEPERVRELQRRAEAVAEHLARRSFVADPLAAWAVSAAAVVREHVRSGWLPALGRVASSTALIGSIVDTFTPAERSYFQGFVDANATAVAAELSRYDAHPDYAIDHLPDVLRTLDSANDWNWLADLYLIEQYHEMVDRGDVRLQRDGDVYWIDPFDLTDTKSLVSSDIVLAAVASSGSFRPGAGISRATAESMTTPVPEPRPLALDPTPEAAPTAPVRPEGAPTAITRFTNHALEQAASRDGGRGVKLSAMEDAVANPVEVFVQRKGRYLFVGKGASAVVTSGGVVVTGWADSPAGWMHPR